MLLLLGVLALLSLAFWRLCRVFANHRHMLRSTADIHNIPDTIPFFGQGHLFPKDTFGWAEFLRFHANLAVQKGHNMMRWWCANKMVIVLLDGESSKMVLESTVELKKGPEYDFFHQWIGNGVLISDGDDWRRQRRMLTPIFHFAMLEQYTPTFNKYGRKLADRLFALEGNTQLVDVSPLLVQCAMCNVTEAVMGVELDVEHKVCRDYMDAIKQFGHFQLVHSLCPLYIMFPMSWYLFGQGWATRKCIRALMAFSAKVVEDRIRLREIESAKNGAGEWTGKAEGENGERPMNGQTEQGMYRTKIMAFLDFLLALEGEDKLSKTQVREQVDAFMFGGHDTVAHGLMWFFWCMACHPEYQQRVQAEIAEHIGCVEADDHQQQQQELEMSAADVNNLSFLDRCIRETMRIFPLVPVMERELEHDMVIGDKKLPRGATVAIPPFLIHHNERVYPRHWEFDPDNFLPERIAKRSPYDYLPFSAGPRNCMGNRFAMLELKIILAHVFRRLRFSTTIPFHKNRPALEAVSRLELGTPLFIHRL